jgi:hypothetical protein
MPAAIVPASVGVAGVPATRLSFIHQYTVCAPRARKSVELTVPEVAAITPGRPKTSFRTTPSPREVQPEGSLVREAADAADAGLAICRTRRLAAEADAHGERNEGVR